MPINPKRPERQRRQQDVIAWRDAKRRCLAKGLWGRDPVSPHSAGLAEVVTEIAKTHLF